MYFKESQSELNFRNATAFYHVYSSPLEMDILYRNDEELNIIINIIALTIVLCNCTILAFAIMSNHLHFILEGPEEECKQFFYLLFDKLKIYYRYNGRSGILDSVELGCKQITSLDQLRAEISYVIRNPFVVRQDINLFACKETSGHLYFNPLLKRDGVPANTLKGRALRDFTHSHKDQVLSGDIYVLDGVAQPWSFVNYQRAMSFFDSAQQFIMITLKNVEAQVEVALRYNEKVTLNEQELFGVSIRLVREMFHREKISDLGRAEKTELAMALKNRYSISNAQIARACRMNLTDVNAMFPLAAKRK